MKPKVEMRIGTCVVVLMIRPEQLAICDEKDNYTDWSDSYPEDSLERKCFGLARAKKAFVSQVYAEITKVRFYFKFWSEEDANSFCKELEKVCNT
ncbi:MAG: hypothetical protein IKE91_06430 [Clostridia bacterium]|nr:hypothetical protein [Clostridia bacterium]